VAFNQEYTTEDITLTVDTEDLTIELKRMVPHEYPGGPAECMKFLSKNIRYPKTAWKNKVQGRVIVQFWVETDGSISDVKVVKGVSWDLNDEAIRVVKSMPNFKPGTVGGEPARIQFTLPIIFRLQ
jgi:protein TonB